MFSRLDHLPLMHQYLLEVLNKVSCLFEGVLTLSSMFWKAPGGDSEWNVSDWKSTRNTAYTSGLPHRIIMMADLDPLFKVRRIALSTLHFPSSVLPQPKRLGTAAVLWCLLLIDTFNNAGFFPRNTRHVWNSKC